MAGQIQVDVTTGGLESAIRSIRRIATKEGRTANFRALRDTANLARTQVRRELRAVKGVPASAINRKVKSFASKRDQESRVWIGLRSGLTYKTAPKGVKAAAPKGFLAKMPSGHAGWFERKPNASTSIGRDSRGRLKRGRLPIEEVRIKLMPEARGIIEKHSRAMFAKRYPGLYRKHFNHLIRR